VIAVSGHLGHAQNKRVGGEEAGIRAMKVNFHSLLETTEYLSNLGTPSSVTIYSTYLRLNLSTMPDLTLRRLMSCIYMEHPFLMFLDHTQRRSTVGRTPLDE